MTKDPKTGLSRYEQIACDIAQKVATGRYMVGDKLRGRSTLAGIYKVSPETIRKAFALLASEGVVEIKPGSGVYVVSAAEAREFLKHFDLQNQFKWKLRVLSDLLEKRRELDRQIESVIEEITAFVGKRVEYEQTHNSTGAPAFDPTKPGHS